MPAPRAYTASMDSVSAVADAALASSDGLAIFYHPTEYGSVDGCKHAAISLQQAFSALRSRARRLNERRMGEEVIKPRDSQATGPYDKLICRRVCLSDNEGWKVEFVHAHALLANLKIVDLKTGLPHAQLGSQADEETRLMNKAFLQRREFTPEDWDRLTFLNEASRGDVEVWHSFDGVCNWPREEAERNHGRAPSPLTSAPRADIVDLASLPSVFGVDGGNEGE